MRKLIAILLSILILSSSVGWTMNRHVCEGKVVKSSISIGLAEIDCGMKKEETDCNSDLPTKDQLNSNPCCQNLHEVFQLEENIDIQNSEKPVNSVFVFAFIHSFISKAVPVQRSPFPLFEHHVFKENVTLKLAVRFLCVNLGIITLLYIPIFYVFGKISWLCRKKW